jgi:hypothetical protein
MKVKRKWLLILLFFVIGFQNFVEAQLPVWFDGGVGIGFPSGGQHFNIDKTHYFGPSFYVIGQTTWNDNWLNVDSLIIGAEISAHFFNARNKVLEQDLRLNSLFLNLSRYFTYHNYRPFINLSLGFSTMNTSQHNFVFSIGGVVRGGLYWMKSKYSPGLSVGYNAPWIAYRNTLTGFWELTFHVRFLSDLTIKHKTKQVPSF